MSALVTDAVWIRPRNPRLVIAGSPASLFAIAAAHARVLDDPAARDDEANRAVIDILVRAGALHRRDLAPAAPADVVVAIPALVRGEAELADLVRLVAALAPLRTVVVDDASPLDPAPALIGHSHCTTQRHDTNRGPAAARNTALAAIAARPSLSCETVVFVDADVSTDSGTLLRLAGHIGGDGTTVAAPRVASVPAKGWLARYEAQAGALDMGPRHARVKPGSRVPYVPTAAVAVDLRAGVAARGFDESLRTGEDVDFVRRLLADAGSGVYDPSITVAHRPRRTLSAFARQRFSYGASAGPLAERHGRAMAPLRVRGIGGALALSGWVCLVAGGLWPPAWLAGSAALAVSVLASSPALMRAGTDPTTAVRVASMSVLSVGHALAVGLTRAWWPITVAGIVAAPRLGVGVVVMFLAAAMRDWVMHPPPSGPRLDAPRFVLARTLDHLAHGAGLWWGAARTQRLDALAPAVSR